MISPPLFADDYLLSLKTPSDTLGDPFQKELDSRLGEIKHYQDLIESQPDSSLQKKLLGSLKEARIQGVKQARACILNTLRELHGIHLETEIPVEPAESYCQRLLQNLTGGKSLETTALEQVKAALKKEFVRPPSLNNKTLSFGSMRAEYMPYPGKYELSFHAKERLDTLLRLLRYLKSGITTTFSYDERQAAYSHFPGSAVLYGVQITTFKNGSGRAVFASSQEAEYCQTFFL